MASLPEFRHKAGAPLWRDLVKLAAEIDGMPRHLSQHVGGMIISSKPVAELVPIEKGGMPGRYVCQWDKDSVDDARMIKIDFLALGMLSLVEECVELIAERRGRCVDLSRIDFNDAAVYDMICAGDTIGVFQIESRAQMQLLPRTQPRSLEDLTQEVAIVRPGPIVGKAVNPFVRRKQGKEPVTYDHPSLEDALKDTLGVVIYQDQVLQVAMALAGFTAGQAEALRRAISRKRSREAMQGFWQQFREGALARGVDEETAQTVFDKLLGFAEFGFPKSHSAAFAVLAYQSSWLKKYYPAEFYCALFNAQPMGFYAPHVFTNDAKRHGVDILNPDINLSGARCTVEDGPGGDAVRVGIGYVRGIGEKAAQAVEEERRRNGPYRVDMGADEPDAALADGRREPGVRGRVRVARRQPPGADVGGRAGHPAARRADAAAAAHRAGHGGAGGHDRLGAHGRRVREPGAFAGATIRWRSCGGAARGSRIQQASRQAAGRLGGRDSGSGRLPPAPDDGEGLRLLAAGGRVRAGERSGKAEALRVDAEHHPDGAVPARTRKATEAGRDVERRRGAIQRAADRRVARSPSGAQLPLVCTSYPERCY